jgi:hypothetical protein
LSYPGTELWTILTGLVFVGELSTFIQYSRGPNN